MKRTLPRITFAALVLMTMHGYAQELLTTADGVRLAGAVRLLAPGAATCRVLRDNESAESYERIRGNDGAPIDLWRLDYSVHNGSGRALDHLIASYTIDVPALPCTTHDQNWEAGETWGERSVHDLPLPAWGRVQHTGSATPTLPGQTHTKPILMLAFRGDEPRFTEWSVNYTFLDSGSGIVDSVPDVRNQPAAANVRSAPLIGAGQDISFGDDTSEWANDGECDDPRFEGPGTAVTLLAEDLLRDATDCRELFKRGEVWLSEGARATGASGGANQ